MMMVQLKSERTSRTVLLLLDADDTRDDVLRSRLTDETKSLRLTEDRRNAIRERDKEIYVFVLIHSSRTLTTHIVPPDAPPPLHRSGRYRTLTMILSVRIRTSRGGAQDTQNTQKHYMSDARQVDDITCPPFQ